MQTPDRKWNSTIAYSCSFAIQSPTSSLPVIWNKPNRFQHQKFSTSSTNEESDSNKHNNTTNDSNNNNNNNNNQMLFALLSIVGGVSGLWYYKNFISCSTDANSSDDAKTTPVTTMHSDVSTNNSPTTDSNSNSTASSSSNSDISEKSEAANVRSVDVDGHPNPFFDLPKLRTLSADELVGVIDLQELRTFHCNFNRQLISVNGTVFDVSDAQDKYGTDGSYKQFAGHDITLALGSGSLNVQWLDRFVQMPPLFEETANEWADFYRKRYPVAGSLKKWNENSKEWPLLSAQELEDIQVFDFASHRR